MARVILADENSLVLDLMRIFLSDEGHDLELVSSADALRDLDAGTMGDAALLILSDSLEPGATSELVHEVRLKTDKARLPCLLTVSPAGRDEHNLASSLVNVHAIKKPFDRGSFLDLVRALADGLSPTGHDQNEQRDAKVAVEDVVKIREVQHTEPAPLEPAKEEEAPKSSREAPLQDDLDRWFKERGQDLVEAEIRSFLERGGEALIQKIVWQVVPELAEAMIRDEINRITKDPDSDTD